MTKFTTASYCRHKSFLLTFADFVHLPRVLCIVLKTQTWVVRLPVCVSLSLQSDLFLASAKDKSSVGLPRRLLPERGSSRDHRRTCRSIYGLRKFVPTRDCRWLTDHTERVLRVPGWPGGCVRTRRKLNFSSLRGYLGQLSLL